jgi:transposase
MRMIAEVLRLHHSLGLSQKKISKALGCSRSTVAEYLHRANAAGLSWPLPEELDETAIERRLFPPVPKAATKPLPDWVTVHFELKRKGVTLVQLWAEYREEFPDGYSLSQFCEHYHRFSNNLNLVMRQEHKAGEKAFSDFAGAKLRIIDPETGEVSFAHLFVCTLGASSFTFVNLFQDETAESWCNGHAQAFEYFGGCPKICVPDNPKPVVTKANPYEPDVNPHFAQMAAHYDVAIIPARVRKPKDKAKVEAAVGLATRWILAVLRNRTFFSLAEARIAVAGLLENLNNRPFKKLPGSRRSQFEMIDKPSLKPLPAVPYEFAQIKNASVNIDYHIEFDRHFYSVPYQFRNEVVEIRATAATVEIFRKGKRIATHPRSYSETKRDVTLLEHRPKNHQEYGDWSPERIHSWALKIGQDAARLVDVIMGRHQYPEQGFRSCQGILRMEKKVGRERLEAACTRALAIRGYSYKSVKSILDSNLEGRPLPEAIHQLAIVHSNLRDPAIYNTHIQEAHDANSPNFRQDESTQAIWHGQSS